MIDIDRGYSKLIEALKTKRAKVTVGIHSDDMAAGKGSTTLGVVASAHEFGTDSVPERSFIRRWYDEQRPALDKVLTQQLQEGLRLRRPVNQSLNRFGLHARAECQKRIRAGIAPELADETIRRKKSSKQLINTGQLINGIRYKVEVST